MKILVVGATGILGSQICKQLRDMNLEVHGVVREGSPKEAEMQAIGVKIVRADVKDSASLHRACEGIDVVVSTAATTVSKRPDDSMRKVDLDGHLSLIEAATDAHVRRFVYVSVSANFPAESAKLMKYKRTVEETLKQTPMEWVILQPSCFTEMWLGSAMGWDFVEGKGRVVGKGDKPVSFVSVSDVAKVAVAAVTTPEAARRVIAVGGRPVAPRDVAEIYQQKTGKAIALQHMSLGMVTAMHAVSRLVSDDVGSKTGMLRRLGTHGDSLDASQALKQDFKIELETVEQYIDKMLTTARA